MHLLNKPYIHALLIIVAVCLVYSNTVNAPFEFDDFGNILYNPAIKDFSLSPDAGQEQNEQVAERLKPLLKTRYVGYLTFAINYRVHGYDVRGYHLVNILIHIISSLLLYTLILFTFRTPLFAPHAGKGAALPEGSRAYIALFAAFLFAVHPVQTQAVTYIVQRFASLAAMLYLLSLVLYLQFRLSVRTSNPASPLLKFRSNARPWLLYAGALLSAILAMKTKEFAFTLPAMIGLYEIMFLTGTRTKRFLYLAPFILAVLIIPLSLVAAGAIGDTYETAAKVSGTEGIISRESYLFTQFRVIVTYLRLLVFPVNQNLDYDYPIFTSFFAPEVFFSFLFLLSILALGIFLYRISRNENREARPWLRLTSFGIFWFFLTIAAESGIIPIADVIFEHRLYLPSAGFWIAFVSVMDLAGARLGARAASVRKIIVYSAILAASVLSATAYARNAVWKESVTLCEDMVRKSPQKARVQYNLGLAYEGLGRMKEAIGAYETALGAENVYSLLTDIYNNLGVAYVGQGRVEEAVHVYKTALNIKPEDMDLRYNLADAYTKLGCLDEAIQEYQTVLGQAPADAKTHFYLGAVYAKQERINEAIREFQIVKHLNPADTIAGKNIEILAAKQARGAPKRKWMAPLPKSTCSK